jgi:hypothetical protein
MQNTDAFERDWRDRRVGSPLHREMTFTQAGLALGRATILAEFEKKGRAAGRLAFDGNEARLLSLLTAAYGEPLAGGVIENIRRAGEFWCSGEKALAHIHLAFMGLPKIDEADAYRLFLAGTALEKGVSPSDLLMALGFPRAARDIEKYTPDQPRVPAGSGRESGQWTTGGNSSEAQPRPTATAPTSNNLQVAQTNIKCSSFIAEKCKGTIMREFPSEYLDLSVDQLLKDAQSGVQAAVKGKKLLFDNRFRK